MPKITPEMIRSARDAFKETAGITIYLPDEGTLDDFEQGRYDGLCAAITSALSAQPVDTRREAFDSGWNMHAALTPAPASSEPVDREAAFLNFWHTCERPADESEVGLSRNAFYAGLDAAHPAPAPTGDGWRPVPKNETVPEAMNGKQVLAYENGRYYNAWLEFEPYEGGWLWTDEADSEPNPSHYRPLPAAPTPEGGRHD